MAAKMLGINAESFAKTACVFVAQVAPTASASFEFCLGPANSSKRVKGTNVTSECIVLTVLLSWKLKSFW